jgi:DNA polymerase III subunit gamma/tau
VTDSALFGDLPEMAGPASSNPEAGPVYRVLARKYRPQTFAELVGQDALVRTLTNAIQAKRIAQAYMLTGVRGIGKTTTARIIAKALNCVGVDGSLTDPTAAPCGVCAQCVAIASDRHVDVLEMDAASRTGVDDIREIIDGVRYGPVMGRYKVYIIDEVHMLSKQAFNALLKTLEEPPSHAKFIFATTEIRKVPVTVLSRCQRFDLRRLDAALLATHFRNVAAKEDTGMEDEAVRMIARAADGSVRDGLSLLDQAIARSDGTVTADLVRDMLGLADRGRILDLFASLLNGDPVGALEKLDSLHAAGADSLVILQDLAALTHLLTRARVTKEDVASLPEMERQLLTEHAPRLSIPALARLWQLLLKALQETQAAPDPALAAEMAIIRICYAADLPPPADLIKQIQNQGPGQVGGGYVPPSGGGGNGGGARMAMDGGGVSASHLSAQRLSAPDAAPGLAPQAALPKTFRDMVALFDMMREGALHAQLFGNVHLVRYEIGRLEIRAGAGAPPNLASRVAASLSEWTGRRWMVSLSNAAGDPSLAEQAAAAENQKMQQAESLPVVRAVLQLFPGAKIKAIHQKADEITPLPPVFGGADDIVWDEVFEQEE